MKRNSKRDSVKNINKKSGEKNYDKNTLSYKYIAWMLVKLLQIETLYSFFCQEEIAVLSPSTEDGGRGMSE